MAFEYTNREIYEVSDQITQDTGLGQGLPTDIRVFCGDIAEGVLEINDDNLLEAADVLDAIRVARSPSHMSLRRHYGRLIDRPPILLQMEPQLHPYIPVFAGVQIRSMLAAARFSDGFLDRFPERLVTAAETKQFIQEGSGLTAAVAGQIAGKALPRLSDM